MNGSVSKRRGTTQEHVLDGVVQYAADEGRGSTGLRRARWKAGELGDRRTEALGTPQPEKREWETLMAGWRGLRKEGERGSG